MAELAFEEELSYTRTVPALPGWHRKQTVLAARPGVGLDAGVHTHVEGMSKAIGCTSKKWSPKGEITKAGFPQPPPETEPVQLGAWEGLKIPQTQQEQWLVSRVEVGEKYPPLLTAVCVSCLWLNVGKRHLGGPLVLLLLYG